MKILISGVLAFVLSMPAALAESDPASEKGSQIARQARDRDSGYVHVSSELRMVLKGKDGRESVRQLRSHSLEVVGDGDKTLIIFDAPKDIAGTGLLIWAHRNQDDDRWLHLPAVKRVKRITASGKSGPFMGSEFTFEDLSSPEVDRYSYKFLKEDQLQGQAVYVIERQPRDENSGYTRQIVYIDKVELRTHKVEFYDRKDSLLKTLQASDFKLYQGKFWRPGALSMQNHQTGKSTLLAFGDYKFRTGLSADRFDPKGLESVR